MNNICFIPAKGNSRRLPRKNLQTVGGKELVLRAIEGAVESGCFEKIIVSSNDDGILELAKSAGVTPLFRKNDLCAEDIRAKDVLRKHLIEEEIYDSVTMLMPTCPLRTGQHIKEAYKKFSILNCETLVSVTEFEFNPSMAMKIENDKLSPFHSDKFKWDREDAFAVGYHMNGAVFIADYDYFMKHATFVENQTVPYVMDRMSSIDVDTPDDLILAKFYWGISNDRRN
jgi:CMP-N,N'-diacetyllegionaminic acid synthase